MPKNAERTKLFNSHKLIWIIKEISMLNKKSLAFTLAEVLITLGIIGIVAALTIPNLIGNSDKQATVSKVKEAYSILSQATVQINNDCGGDITDCISNPGAGLDNAAARKDVVDQYKANLSVILDCTDGTTTGCFASGAYKYLNTNNTYIFETNGHFTNARILLKNGISVAFCWLGQVYSPEYFDIYIDINGAKSPNQVAKDTFVFYYDINKKTLEPYTLANDCSISGNGWNCSAKILQESAINYY